MKKEVLVKFLKLLPPETKIYHISKKIIKLAGVELDARFCVDSNGDSIFRSRHINIIRNVGEICEYIENDYLPPFIINSYTSPLILEKFITKLIEFGISVEQLELLCQTQKDLTKLLVKIEEKTQAQTTFPLKN